MTVKDVVRICETNFIIVKNNEIVHESFWNGLARWENETVKWLDANEQGIIYIGI